MANTLQSQEIIVIDDESSMDESFNSLDVQFNAEELSNALSTISTEDTVTEQMSDDLTNVPLDHSVPHSLTIHLMNCFFNYFFAKSCVNVIPTVSVRHCEGCRIEHPSQNQHSCLNENIMNLNDREFIEFSFNEILLEVNEENILKEWVLIMQTMNLSKETIENQRGVLANPTYRQVMKTEDWRDEIIDIMCSIIKTQT